MEAPDVNYPHYRESTVGEALRTTLDEFVSDGKLTEEQAVAVLLEFDKQMNRALATQPPRLMFLSGEISTYNNAENTWNWRLSKASFKVAESEQALKKLEPTDVEKVNVVATDAFPGRIHGRKKKKAKTDKK